MIGGGGTRTSDRPVRPPPADPIRYLRDLLDKTAYIDIRGLERGHRAGPSVPHRTTVHLADHHDGAGRIGRTSQPNDGAGKAEDAGRRNRRGRRHGSVPLHEALQNDRLVVVGDPGSGKTTFLRRVAHALCRDRTGRRPARRP